jgi:hypothetical protein
MKVIIEAKDLIVVDATIIGGLLILLTISSFSQAEFPNRSIFASIAVIIVIFFAASSFFILHNRMDDALKMAKIGLISIIMFMVFIGMANIINIIDPYFWQEKPIASKIASNNETAISNNDNSNQNTKVAYYIT